MCVGTRRRRPCAPPPTAAAVPSSAGLAADLLDRQCDAEGAAWAARLLAGVAADAFAAAAAAAGVFLAIEYRRMPVSHSPPSSTAGLLRRPSCRRARNS